MTAGEAIVTFLTLLAAVVLPSAAILVGAWLIWNAVDALRDRW